MGGLERREGDKAGFKGGITSKSTVIADRRLGREVSNDKRRRDMNILNSTKRRDIVFIGMIDLRILVTDLESKTSTHKT